MQQREMSGILVGIDGSGHAAGQAGRHRICSDRTFVPGIGPRHIVR